MSIGVRTTAIAALIAVMAGGCAHKEKVRALDKESFTNGVGMQMIKLSTGYYVSKYEIQQSEFEKVVGYNPSFSKGPHKPVEYLTVQEAELFCKKLTDQEQQQGLLPPGFVYRLPTFLEWKEYVADASLTGSVTPYGRPGGAPAAALDVGSGETNSLGICDLRGNVSEYSQDVRRSTGTNVILGGDFCEYRDDFLDIDNKASFRSAADKSLDVGFRCVLVKP